MAIIKHLVVDEFGTHVGKHSERLQVTRIGNNEKLLEAPLLHLETVIISGRGISLSADVVEACAERGIPIHFMNGRGNLSASLYSAGLTGTVQTRRAQLLVVQSGRGLALAKAFAKGKIWNQTNLLKYMVKNRRESDPELYQEIHLLVKEILDHEWEVERLQASSIEEVRSELLSIEGRAAQKYWEGIGKLLLSDLPWPGRRTQGATDPLNSALNYGYGILYAQIERSLILAGLDPYGGILHVDRPGKPSLVLDCIEEFRQTVVDRTIFGLVNKKVALRVDEKGHLDKETRQTLAEKIFQRLDSRERYEGKQMLLRSILQMQVRHLATFVRGERENYEPFVGGW